MADFDDVSDKLLQKIDELAEKTTTNRSDAEAYSAAAKNLAEARAWLTSVSQPH